MSKAILTIDDSPTKITPRIIDYLCEKGITPLINVIGAAIADHFDEAVYAVKNGAILGNHSFSHDHFSSIPLDKCRDEIIRTEREIERVYQAAGAQRAHRVFRFPYGDKGGAQAESLQKMLREEFQFERLDDSDILFPFWKKYHLDIDTDMIWTFDFVEYQLAWNNGYTWEDILRAVHDTAPVQGGCLLGERGTSIVLIHDMEETDRFMKQYFEKIIDYVLSCGVAFVPPRFIPQAKAK